MFNYSAPDRAAEYCDERVCLSVCVCLSAIVSPELHVRSSPDFLVYVTYGRGSVLLWLRIDTLCTSGFMDDVIFAQKLRLLDVAASLMGLLQLRYEHDSSTIRLRFGYNTLEHATRFFVRSHTRSYTRISGRRVLHVD